MVLSSVDEYGYLQSPLSSYKPIELRKIDDAIMAFWLPYMQRSLVFYIDLNEEMHFKIEPYYGLVFNEYDIVGQSYFLDLDFGSDEAVSISLPRALLNLILSRYLEPLLPEHFDDNFVCNVLEMICVDVLGAIKSNTGTVVSFRAFSGVKGKFKSQWRVYLNDKPIFYPILCIGSQPIIEDLLKRLFVDASYKPKIQSTAELKIVNAIRKISLKKLKNLRLGEIIVLMTKRHPVNEPLGLIGNKIVLHTILKDMELHLTREPSMIHDVEELKMTMQDDDIDALPEFDNSDNSDNSDNELEAAINDYKVTVTFEISRLEIPVNMISQLTEGSILNLQKPITDDIFLTVSGRTIAIGEVVQIGRNFGVLIKEVFNG
jgi:flagellar motor switch/type III secretory pathway protein FliN